MSERAAVEYIELDVNVCSLSYGVAPCTASIPGTGAAKCFNTKKTCQDRNNYAGSTVTLRFSGQGTHYPHSTIEAIASIETVGFTPAIISLGEDLGQRASLNVTFRDHPWSDTGPGGDKYWSERDYDPFSQGTFWGKFRARQPFMRGVVLRWYSGFADQTLEEMERRTFVVESFSGPTLDGKFTLTAKDPIKMLDGDRAQAPRLSNGFLNADIDADDTSLTLSPAGIGDLEYPSGSPDYFVAIGGVEIVKVTGRTGDVLTIERAQKNTEAKEHKAQDRVQLCLDIVAEPPSAIFNTLFVDYASVPAEWIPLESWEAEEASKLGQVYSRCIAEPTSVAKLTASLIKVAGASLFWDDIGEKFRFKVLGQIATDADVFDRSNTIKQSLSIREQPNLRVSQVWTYFAQINPLKKEDDTDNYRSTAVMVDLEREGDYGLPAIKKIFAPWIADLGRQPAMRVSALQLGRFRDPPRFFSFNLHRGEIITPVAGEGYRIEGQPMQDAFGAAENVPIQLTRVAPKKGHYEAEAFEMLWQQMDDFDPDSRVIIIDGNRANVNIRAAYDQLYPEPDSETIVEILIEENVRVYSIDSSLPALDTGLWPEGATLNLHNHGDVIGKGGNPGPRIGSGTPWPGNTGWTVDGEDGGVALKVQHELSLYSYEGARIAGGGGGGRAYKPTDHRGIGTGGGGQGSLGGVPTGGAINSGSTGTLDAPGVGYYSTNGGELGQDGGSTGRSDSDSGSYGGDSGAAGAAIDGDNLVTIELGDGSIIGPQIN